MQQNFASSDILEHWNRLGVRHSLKSQTIDSQNLVTYKEKKSIFIERILKKNLVCILLYSSHFLLLLRGGGMEKW